MHLPLPFLSLSDMIDLNARSRPRDVAWSDPRDEHTWSDFAGQVNRDANVFVDLGVSTGDVVAMMSDSSYWTWHVAFGAIRAGGVVAPLNTMLQPRVLATMLTKSHVSVLIVGDPYLELAAAAVDLLAQDERPRLVSERGALAGSLDFASAQSAASPESPAVQIGATDGMTVVYSSGTTGVPKGVLHTHEARLATATNCGLAYEVGHGTRLYLTTPPHTNGSWMMVLPTIFAGGRIHVADGFDVDQFLLDVEKLRPTHSFVVPTIGARLLKHPRVREVDWSCFEVMLTAGAPMPLEMKHELRELSGNALGEAWGFSEGLAASMHPRDMGDHLDSVGRAIPGCDLRVIGDDDVEVQSGQIGELVGRSSLMLQQYHHDPATTAALVWRSPAGETYIRTGDFGQIDPEGWVSIRGRKKDMIITGGLNVFPIDIEDVLRLEPDVEECAVVGVPHDDWGETPVAFVVARPDRDLDASVLRESVNKQLGRHQRVAEVRVIPALPRNALGKVMKHQLVDSY